MERKDNKNEHVPSISPELLQKWLKSRSRTSIIFAVQNFLLGVDASFLLMTLLMYLKTLVKTDHFNFFYGMIIFCCNVLPSCVFMPLISKYADQTRNIRYVMFLIHYSLILGNILYIIYYSVWFLVLGRFLTGFGLLSRSIMNGEITRSYLPSELPNKLSYLGMTYMLGFIFGPTLDFFFLNVEFSVFTLKMNYLNIPSLVMSILFLILHICSLLMVSNLSKTYDLKADLRDCKERNENVQHFEIDDVENDDVKTSLVGRKSEDNNISAKSTFKKVLKNSDIAVLLICTSIHTFINCCFYLWIPLIVIEKLHWTVKSLGWLNIAIAISSVAPLAFCLRYQIGKTLLYRLGLASEVSLLIGQIILTVQAYVGMTALNILMWVVYCSVVVMVSIADEIFFVAVLAQMVKTEHQTFVDGLRLSLYRFFCGLPSFIAPFLIDKMYIGATMHISLALVSITLMLVKRESFQNPTITYS